MRAGPVRTVFLGSGEFAVPALAALVEDPVVDVVAAVTAPPRPAGRRQQVQATPIGRWAASNGLPVLAPDRVREPESVSAIAGLEPALLVLADYGQIVPAALIDLPAHGALNLHPSLLPRHRGAAPIQATILAGDERGGVTLILMDTGLDSGPIVAQRPVDLDGSETAPLLEERLAEVAAELLRDTLPAWLDGAITPLAQAHEGATMTRPLRRADGRLDPARPAFELERQVRAMQPWPGTHLEAARGRLGVWRAAVVEAPGPAGEPGDLVAHDDGLALVTPDGSLELLEVQLAGGRRMSGAELLRGHPGLLTVR